MVEFLGVRLADRDILVWLFTTCFYVLGYFAYTEWVRRKRLGRLWLVEQNSNTKFGRVERVQTGSEGYQVPNGPFVKFEGDFAYWDRLENRPLFVYNGDTGFIIRSKTGPEITFTAEEQGWVDELRRRYPAAMVSAKTGESEELDGVTLAAFSSNHDIERFNEDPEKQDYAKLAFYAVIIVGMVMATLAFAWYWYTQKGGGPS